MRPAPVRFLAPSPRRGVPRDPGCEASSPRWQKGLRGALGDPRRGRWGGGEPPGWPRRGPPAAPPRAAAGPVPPPPHVATPPPRLQEGHADTPGAEPLFAVRPGPQKTRTDSSRRSPPTSSARTRSGGTRWPKWWSSASPTTACGDKGRAHRRLAGPGGRRRESPCPSPRRAPVQVSGGGGGCDGRDHGRPDRLAPHASGHSVCGHHCAGRLVLGRVSQRPRVPAPDPEPHPRAGMSAEGGPGWKSGPAPC